MTWHPCTQSQGTSVGGPNSPVSLPMHQTHCRSKVQSTKLEVLHELMIISGNWRETVTHEPSQTVFYCLKQSWHSRSVEVNKCVWKTNSHHIQPQDPWHLWCTATTNVSAFSLFNLCKNLMAADEAASQSRKTWKRIMFRMAILHKCLHMCTLHKGCSIFRECCEGPATICK